MDFLDSLDLDTTHKKSHRVRSWYLLEQYKSLERSQLDAAHKLRERSYQDNILLTELRERKQRRTLCSQCSLSQPSGDCKRLYKTISIATKTPSDLTTDDLYESFCEYPDDDFFATIDNQTFEGDDPVESETGRVEFDSVNNDEECRLQSREESVHSVVEVKSCETLAGEEEAEVKPTVEHHCHVHSKNCHLGKFTPFSFEQKNDVEPDVVTEAVRSDCMFLLWSRLVAFAYHVTKLNRGNCYSDYSTQFLTAVLACDILRLGVHKMSNILQRYTSPVKLSNDDESTCPRPESIKIRRPCKKRIKSTPLPRMNKARRRSRQNISSIRRADVHGNNNLSEGCRPHYSEDSLVNNDECGKVPRAVSAPGSRRGTKKDPQCDSCNDWRHEFENLPCNYKTENPMLKVIEYIEGVLQTDDDVIC